jgi:MarR family transcriptional regulator, temperature-dependent positive regulator of motility
MAKRRADEAGGVPALDESPSHLLHRAVQVALDVYALEFGPAGVTQRQYAVLAAVEAREGLTQSDLVQDTGIDRSTLADMVARMIAKGLLERERSTLDARANAVRLTPEGRATLEAARPKMAVADAQLLRRLPGRDREAFLRLLRGLAEGRPAKGPRTDKEKAEKAARKAAKAERKAAKVAKKVKGAAEAA